jgi:hypothetical protein
MKQLEMFPKPAKRNTALKLHIISFSTFLDGLNTDYNDGGY